MDRTRFVVSRQWANAHLYVGTVVELKDRNWIVVDLEPVSEGDRAGTLVTLEEWHGT